ncbi:MAG: hypothetical protein KF902_15140 [Phycisphaeraceae bacterium]|nr:hypothetical protein [Phycisphaeraceae bacterium]
MSTSDEAGSSPIARLAGIIRDVMEHRVDVVEGRDAYFDERHRVREALVASGDMKHDAAIDAVDAAFTAFDDWPDRDTPRDQWEPALRRDLGEALRVMAEYVESDEG